MLYTVSIKSNRDFRRLYARGKNAAVPTLAVYYRKNRSQKNAVGITVGTKLGNAVTRNKVKRRIREAYRLQEKDLLSGYDMVIVARKRAVLAGYGEIVRDMTALFRKSKILRE